VYNAALPLYLFRDLGFSVQTVGTLVGMAAVVQLAGTLVTGPLIDRYGARLALRVGPSLHFCAALIFLGATAVLPIGGARVLQGLALALMLPAAYSLAPSLAAPRYRATAFGIVGVLQNLALAAGPPLGLWLLGRGPTLLFLTATASASLGLVLSLSLRAGTPPLKRSAMFKFRASWTPLLAATFLTVLFFGPILAYLPIHVAQHDGGNVGWFFTADAIALLLLRVPTGYITDRLGSRWLLIGGIVITAVSNTLLLAPPSLVLLLVTGAGAGIGAAMLYPPILLELSKRSNDSDRGTAMALYSSCFAGAIGAGSLGGAFSVAHFGFPVTLVLGTACCLAALPVVLVSVGPREPV